jgi:hypothetical protein
MEGIMGRIVGNVGNGGRHKKCIGVYKPFNFFGLPKN